MSTATRVRYTPQEYLSLERKSLTKHEYHDGEISAMAGTTREHSLIGGNLARAIGNQFEDRPCEVHTSDLRVSVSEPGVYTYPDVVAVCGEPRFLDNELDTLLNPTVIAEVLSESTEAYDRGAKFRNYRRIPSLREYVLVAQDRMSVERYTRQGDDWIFSELTEPDQALRLESIGCDVPLKAIYSKVQFPLAEAPPNGLEPRQEPASG
jgi:Uma2 family endonuclease